MSNYCRFFGLIFIFVTFIPWAFAYQLDSLLQETINTHDRIDAAKADVDASRNRAREALSVWFPTVDITANKGKERHKKAKESDPALFFNEIDVKFTQLLWDFGAANAEVEKARLRMEDSQLTLIKERQALILEAATAYLNVQRSSKVLEFAQQSEDNIFRQTGLEKIRVEEGFGFSADVLQSQSQHAGAEARRIQWEGTLLQDINGFREMFKISLTSAAALESMPEILPSVLPASLDAAIELALEHNPEIRSAQLKETIASADWRSVRGKKFFPKLDFSVDRKWKENVSATKGKKIETVAKFEMTMAFDLGLTAVNSLRAANSDIVASHSRLQDTRQRIDKEVRNAWQKLITNRAVSASLTKQAEISAGFLEIARKERKLGQRSLIDVLSGETSWTNALSDAEAAKTDILIAQITLMKTLGLLNIDLFKNTQQGQPTVSDNDQSEAKRNPEQNSVMQSNIVNERNMDELERAFITE